MVEPTESERNFIEYTKCSNVQAPSLAFRFDPTNPQTKCDQNDQNDDAGGEELLSARAQAAAGGERQVFANARDVSAVDSTSIVARETDEEPDGGARSGREEKVRYVIGVCVCAMAVAQIVVDVYCIEIVINDGDWVHLLRIWQYRFQLGPLFASAERFE